MTTEKMPDVYYIEKFVDEPVKITTHKDNVFDVITHTPDVVRTKYLRAEPVEELLRQAADALCYAFSEMHYDKHSHMSEEKLDNYLSDIKNAITTIDKFLGEK